MSIQVGIVENVAIVSAEFTEKNSLEIMFQQGESKPMSLIDLMNTGASEEQNTQKIIFYPLDSRFYGKDATPEEMVMKIRQLVAKFTHLMSVQVEKPEFDMFAGLNLETSEEIFNNILKEDIIAQVNKNLYTQMVDMITNSDTSKKSRIKFIRQSAAKHYAAIPEYLNFKKDGGTWNTPFVESMEIPKAQSKLAYTAKEIAKGSNSGTPIEADAATPFDI
jgi:hypothetical protein